MFGTSTASVELISSTGTGFGMPDHDRDVRDGRDLDSAQAHCSEPSIVFHKDFTISFVYLETPFIHWVL